MPFVFGPAYSEPMVDFLTAALGAAAEGPKGKQQQKPAACGPGACGPRRKFVYKRLINPHFDISELENEYVLEGELPGVSDKSSISINFDDAQTIAIKGEIKRDERAAPVAPEKVQLTEKALQAAAAASESTTTLVADEQPKETVRYAATVEDDVDESETASDFEVVDGPNPSRVEKGKAKETADVEMTEAKPTEKTQKKETQPLTPSARYWVAERSIGVFERKFNFQGLIDQDNVKASLEHGLLTVVVPKRQAYVRQVQIE